MKQGRDNFNSNMAVLVALVTIFGAIAACRASVAAADASDADFDGVSAATEAQKEEIVNEVNAYEHYRAYVTHVRYLELGNLLYSEDTDSNSTSQEAQWQELWGLADALQNTFYPPRYEDLQNGGYDIQRELDEAAAEDSQLKDLNPTPHFERSNVLRLRSLVLTGDLIIYAFSFWLFTVAQAIRQRTKYIPAILGILTWLVGALVAILAETRVVEFFGRILQ